MKKGFTIIRRPMITEKMTRLQEKLNQYAFEVDPQANKIEIKKAIEECFKVHVLKVHTIVQPGKLKRMGRFSGIRPDWKKAIVTLPAGEKIELLENA